MYRRYEMMIIAANPLFNPHRYPNTSYFYARFDCPDGWATLLAEFAYKVSCLRLNSFVLYEVKEKYNQLHIYAECEEEQVNKLDDLISEIEERSRIVCGRCGNPLSAFPHKCHGRAATPGSMEQWLETFLEDHKP